MKKYSLGIVQSHATQFDGPLFRMIANSLDVELTVYYTKPDALIPSYDPELDHQSGWDHDITSGYCSCLFPRKFVDRILFVHKIVKSRHDLVVVSGYRSLVLFLLAVLGKVYKVPIGMRSDSVSLYRKNEGWEWLLKNVALRLVYKFYATGHPTGALASSYMQNFGFSEKNLFLFPYSVDNEFIKGIFDRELPNGNEFRRNLGIGLGDFVILGVLKLIPREDPCTLLLAYNQIFQRYPQAHLVLVGDGLLRESIERYIVENKLTHVHLLGYIPYSQLPRCYALADVFVHPALVEPWGVSVNEAMVCGVPVIVADTVGSGPDLIESDITGYIFKSGDFGSLADLISKLIEDPALCRSLSSNALDRIRGWNYETTFQYILNALMYLKTK